MNAANQQPSKQTQANFAPFAPREISKPDMGKYSDLELLGKLLGVREAKRIYKAGGSLAGVFSGHDAPLQVLVARELLSRYLNAEMMGGNALNSPSAVRDFLKLHFAGQQYESFAVIFLDAQHRVIAFEELFKGTLTQTSVYPREVVKAALKHNAAAAIFAHNHPSGVAEPSQSDRMLTDALKQALSLVDVRSLDHFIVAGNSILSFAERGLI